MLVVLNKFINEKRVTKESNKLMSALTIADKSTPTHAVKSKDIAFVGLRGSAVERQRSFAVLRSTCS